MKHRARKHLALICALLVCSVAGSSARVFLRWGAASQSTRALQGLGGKIAYEATVIINGGKGDLAVFNFDRAPSDLMTELRKTFGVKQFGFAQGNTAITTFGAGNRMVRLIALRLGGADRTLVFKIEQSRTEFRLSNARPSTHLLSRLPAYPGSEPEFFVKDENTASSLAISTGDGSPEDVREFYSTRLTAAGWTSALAPKGRTPGLLENQSMAVYLKDRHICCVMVSPDRAGTSRITLLHKTQGMK